MNIAINGFGRIGRSVFRAALERNINIIAINDVHGPKDAAYLLKYDSVYGNYNKEITYNNDYLKINNKKIKVLSERDPGKLPWKKLNVHTVVESTGIFTERKGALSHLNAGAKKVLISAPAKNPDITIVPGVNHDKLKKSHRIISLASCTTNALAPVAKVLNDKFEIETGFMTTAHAYTTTQGLLDSSNEKLRRGRAAATNIVPTTSGATKAVVEVIPELKGKIKGLALRVPVPCGSIVDFVAVLNKNTNVKVINETFQKAAKNEMKNIMDYKEEELVSSDIIGNTHSAIIDGLSTQVLKNNLVKVLAWYDNEYGYSCRMADLIKMVR